MGHQAMQGTNCIAHFATHALLKDADDSALALAGSGEEASLLMARDIYAERFSSEVVVLSGCNTGRGELGADGVAGLGRAFNTTGAKQVIMTLWKVRDRSTQEFMIKFYKH